MSKTMNFSERCSARFKPRYPRLLLRVRRGDAARRLDWEDHTQRGTFRDRVMR